MSTVHIILDYNVAQLANLFQHDRTLVCSYRALQCDWYAGVAAAADRRVYHYRDRHENGKFTRHRHDVLISTPDSLGYIRGTAHRTFHCVVVDTIDDVLIKVLADSPLNASQRDAVLSLLQASMRAAEHIVLVVSSVARVPLARLAATVLAPNATVTEFIAPLDETAALAPLVLLENDAAVLAQLELAVRAVKPTAERPLLDRPLLIYSPACTSMANALPLEETVRGWLEIHSRFEAPPIGQPITCTALSLHPTFEDRGDERHNREFARDPVDYVSRYKAAVVICGPAMLGVRFTAGMFGESFVLLPSSSGDADVARRALRVCRLAAERRCVAVESLVALADDGAAVAPIVDAEALPTQPTRSMRSATPSRALFRNE